MRLNYCNLVLKLFYKQHVSVNIHFQGQTLLWRSCVLTIAVGVTLQRQIMMSSPVGALSRPANLSATYRPPESPSAMATSSTINFFISLTHTFFQSETFTSVFRHGLSLTNLSAFRLLVYRFLCCLSGSIIDHRSELHFSPT